MGDLFDPRRLLDDDDPLDPVAAVARDGTLVLEHLEALDSWMSTVGAIGALDERGRRAALLMAVIAVKRAQGMTDAEYERWLLKDLPKKGDQDR